MLNREEKFGTLVQRLQDAEKAHPELFRLGVAIFALLGYAYILLIVAVLLGFAILLVSTLFSSDSNFVVMQLVVAVFAVLGMFLQSLWVKLNAPEGLIITGDDAPQLLGTIQSISRELHGPTIHKVLGTAEFNASIWQVPRLGIFGFQQNYLCVGLPLMQTLSPQEFRAVLAHEFGHLSGNHGRFGGWIYRIRRTWSQVIEQLENRKEHSRDFRVKTAASLSHSLMGPFFHWFTHKLDACSFVLSRAQEKEADRHAAMLFGGKALASALANISVRGQVLANRVWKQMYENAASRQLPADFATQVADAVAMQIVPDDIAKLLSPALQKETGLSDTHPCLRERLQALGFELSQATPEGLRTWASDLRVGAQLLESAADYFLGPAEGPTQTRLQQAWYSNVAPQWQKQFDERQRQAARCAELELQRKNGTINEEQLLELATATEVRRPEIALDALTDLLARSPGQATAELVRGRILLNQDDPSGLEDIEKAIAADVTLVFDACRCAIAYFRRIGDTKSVSQYEERINQAATEFEAARKERESVSAGDGLLPHELDGSTVRRLASLFAEYPHLDKAYIARKRVQHLPQIPYYVVGLLPKTRFFRFGITEDDRNLLEVAKWIQLDSRIVVLKTSYRWLLPVIQEVPGALIFDRSINTQEQSLGASA